MTRSLSLSSAPPISITGPGRDASDWDAVCSEGESGSTRPAMQEVYRPSCRSGPKPAPMSPARGFAQRRAVDLRPVDFLARDAVLREPVLARDVLFLALDFPLAAVLRAPVLALVVRRLAPALARDVVFLPPVLARDVLFLALDFPLAAVLRAPVLALVVRRLAP